MLIRSAALLFTFASLGAASASPVELMPHRAVYDLRLAASGESMTDAPTAMNGRMVYEFTGSACEGYTVNFRFVLEATDPDGKATVTDLRASTFEEPNFEGFQFITQTYNDQVLTEDVKGSASRTADGVKVAIESPEKADLAFPGPVSFPTEHLVKIIAAAETGASVLEQDVYDGSDGGGQSYQTTTIIGPARSAPPEGDEARIGDLRRWPVTVSYFDRAATGDRTPDYSIAFDLWENGVSTDMTMDYGDFALKGALAEYEELPASSCN